MILRDGRCSLVIEYVAIWRTFLSMSTSQEGDCGFFPFEPSPVQIFFQAPDSERYRLAYRPFPRRPPHVAKVPPFSQVRDVFFGPRRPLKAYQLLASPSLSLT